MNLKEILIEATNKLHNSPPEETWKAWLEMYNMLVFLLYAMSEHCESKSLTKEILKMISGKEIGLFDCSDLVQMKEEIEIINELMEKEIAKRKGILR